MAQVYLVLLISCGIIELAVGIYMVFNSPRRIREGTKNQRGTMHSIRGGLVILTGTISIIMLNAGWLGPLQAALLTFVLICLEGYVVSTLYKGA